jgi:hypothetical protein
MGRTVRRKIVTGDETDTEQSIIDFFGLLSVDNPPPL